MIRIVIIVTWLTVLGGAGHAQILTERLAFSSLHKHNWTRAQLRLQKAMHKDSSNAIAWYVYSLYFFAPGNPARHIDSAYRYNLKALAGFGKSDSKQRERMKRFPVDSAIVLKLQKQIDSAAFERAKNYNTEAAYLFFLANFTNAQQRNQAVELRDEVSYQAALKLNTYSGFLTFLHKYPSALQAANAQKLYDRLLYEQKTKDKRLATYENFLAEYPATPYRVEIEKNIFGIFTASGEDKIFEAFLKKYPASSSIPKARRILQYILQENNPGDTNRFLQHDSAITTQGFSQTYLVPFLKDGKFGFMNSRGEEMIGAVSKTIGTQYLCGNITEDVIVLPDHVLTNNGTIIYQDKIDDWSDLGYGFLKIVTPDANRIVLHKSGFMIAEPETEDVKLLNGKFIALKHGGLWSVWTLTGRKLMNYDWDEINTLDNIVVFKKQEKYKLLTPRQIGLLADQHEPKSQDFFDHVKAFPHQLIWVGTNEYEGVLDPQMNIRVPFEKHILEPAFADIISSSSLGKRIYNSKGDASPIFKNIKVNRHWTAVKESSSWRLFNDQTFRYESTAFDSIDFLGPFAIGYLADTLTVYFQGGQDHQFQSSHLEFIPGKDSTAFLLVEEGDKMMLYNMRGDRLFMVNYDKILYGGNDIFIVIKKDKKGLVASDGRILLPAEYDAIGGVNNQTISLLKNMKFGLYNIVSRKLIKPQFDKNLNCYNGRLLTGFKNGFYGFIDWEMKPVSNFEFDEIIFWDDKLALVKEKFQWMFWDIENRMIADKFEDYKIIIDGAKEKIAIINQEGKCGVISSVRGEIIPANFTGIKNLGSAEEPLYFANMHIEEAAVFVVIYYDKDGKLIRRQVYEEAEYERIYCPD